MLLAVPILAAVTVIALLAIAAWGLLQVRLQTVVRHRGPVRRVAVPLLLLGLLLPTVAQASPAPLPLRWRSSAVASGEGEISSRGASREGASFGENRTSGFRLFLQVDPAGYQDSPNLYAGFGNDPVNRRDPTGECYWEIGAGEQEKCWQSVKWEGDPKSECGETLREIVEGRRNVLDPEASRRTYECLFATYSARRGVTISDEGEKANGANLDGDRLHRRFVRLIVAYEVRCTRNRRGYGDYRNARDFGAGTRKRLKLSESLLGRDANRYYYGRISPYWAVAQKIYDAKKRKGDDVRLNREHPASAAGGEYFL